MTGKMRNYSIVFFLCFFICLFSVNLFGQETEKEKITNVINKMINARKSYSFIGDITIKMHKNDKQRVISKKVWFVPPDRYREEIILPHQKGLMVNIMNASRFITIIDGKPRHTRHRRPHDPVFPIFLLKRIKENFDIAVTKGETIAGRETDIISLNSKISDRRNYKFWIDNETGVTLKRVVFRKRKNQAGAYFEKYFTSIQYNPVIDEHLFEIKELKRRPSHWKTREYNTIEEVKKEVPFPIIAPAEIPEGFALGRIRITRERRNVTIHLNYSDGITSFSIFQTKGPPPPFFDNRFGKRPEKQNDIIEISKESRSIFFRKMGPFNVTVIGNCSKEILRPVIENISLPWIDPESR